MDDSLAWLCLALIPGLGPIGAKALLESFGTPRAIAQAPQGTLAVVVGPRLAAAIAAGPVPSALDAHRRWADAPNNTILTLADPRYPRLLREIPDPPPVLFAVGRIDLLDRPTIAIVGSRHASPQGRRDARQFAAALSAADVCVVSGLALGIDAAAHEGALLGAGSTIAVIGTGVDVTYPLRNAELTARIAASGVIVSEFALGTPARPGNFPRRNRLISGLARACLVVEAAIDSGSLITARLAADQGRDVFALPGSIHSPVAKGCHALIRDGATLVERVEHVLEAFAPLGVVVAGNGQPTPPQADHPLLRSMGYAAIDIDTLCLQSGLTPDVVSAMLLTLEMEGAVATLPGGRYQRLA